MMRKKKKIETNAVKKKTPTDTNLGEVGRCGYKIYIKSNNFKAYLCI